jgi:hypothetical protein
LGVYRVGKEENKANKWLWWVLNMS